MTPIFLRDKRIPFSGSGEMFQVHSLFPDKLHAVISIIHLLSVTFSSCGRENGLPEGQIKMILRFYSSKESSGARFVCGYTLHISSILFEVGLEFLKAGGNLSYFPATSLSLSATIFSPNPTWMRPESSHS